jgi:K+-sensing histidine kinase KdpD
VIRAKALRRRGSSVAREINCAFPAVHVTKFTTKGLRSKRRTGLVQNLKVLEFENKNSRP